MISTEPNFPHFGYGNRVDLLIEEKTKRNRVQSAALTACFLKRAERGTIENIL